MGDGWSFVHVAGEGDAFSNAWEYVRMHPQGQAELSPEMSARIAEIDERIDELEALSEENDGLEDEQQDEFEELIAEREGLASGETFFTDEQKAEGGVFIADDGRVTYGISLKSRFGDGTSSSSSGAKEKAKPKLPDGMTAKVQGEIMYALSDAIRPKVAADGDLALALLLARFEHEKVNFSDSKAPIVASISDKRPGATMNARSGKAKPFSEILEKMLKLDREKLIKAIADHVAGAIDVSVGNLNPFNPISEEADAIRKTIIEASSADPVDTFDYDTFFDGISKDAIVAAYREIKGDPEASLTGKKGEIAALASELAKQVRWLPTVLRHSRYDGPGAPLKTKAKRKSSGKPAAKPTSQVADDSAQDAA
jgi:hypothetical protein